MKKFLEKISAELVLEIFAVIFNLLFTILYLNSSQWCYLFGVLGPAFFVILCYRKSLFAEVLLQGFYIILAIYGFLNWGGEWRKLHWTFAQNLPYIIAGVILVLLSGLFLSKYTKAKLVYIDSFTTVYGIIGTWLMVNYVHENWLYFIAINLVSIYMYASRSMWLASAMYLFYLLMAIDGFFELGIFYS
jgi:nicotinamide mononucleotide transporter